MFLSHSRPERAFRTLDGSPYGQIDNSESVRSKEGTESKVVIQIIEDGHCVLEASGRSQRACLRQQSVGLSAKLHISPAALNLVDYVYLRTFTPRSTLTRQNAGDLCWIGQTNAIPDERKIILGVLFIRDSDIHKLS